MNCFENYIGVSKSCDDQVPDSGLYFDKLPGVTLRKAALVANGEVETGSKLIKDCIDTAVTIVSEQFIAELSEHYQFNSIIGQESRKSSGEEIMLPTDKNTGLQFTKYDPDPLQSLYLSSIGFYSTSDTNLAVYVQSMDGESKKVKLKVNKGYNHIRLDFETMSDWIRVWFNRANITIGKGLTRCNSCVDQCECRCCKIEGISSDNVCNWDESTSAYGLDYNIQCRCSEKAFICQYSKDLKLPIWYMAGILFMQEVLSTDRVSNYTFNAEDEVKNLLVRWEGGIDKVTGWQTQGMYLKFLKSAVKKVQSQIGSLASRCVSCSGTRIVSELP